MVIDWMAVMIDCCVMLLSAERSRGQLMDLAALKEVSSAKRLDAPVTKLMFFTALRWALFEILDT